MFGVPPSGGSPRATANRVNAELRTPDSALLSTVTHQDLMRARQRPRPRYCPALRPLHLGPGGTTDNSPALQCRDIWFCIKVPAGRLKPDSQKPQPSLRDSSRPTPDPALKCRAIFKSSLTGLTGGTSYTSPNLHSAWAWPNKRLAPIRKWALNRTMHQRIRSNRLVLE